MNIEKPSVGVVTAVFNEEVTLRLERAALEELKKAGISGERVHALRVPGAFEIPLAIQVLFERKNVDAVVALGAVIRGDTAHFDYVCGAVERGCSELALRFKKPVGFGVLTTDTESQALDRAGGSCGNKGSEAVQAVLTMCKVLRTIG